MDLITSPDIAAWVGVAAAESAPPTLPPGHAHPTTCLNCDSPLTDKFCGHCGQPAATHRITLKHFLFHDLPHSVWHVDKGLAYTFYQMLTRPGLTIRGYLAGQRTRQFHPISYMLLLVGLSTLGMSFFHAALLKASAVDQPHAAVTAVVMERYLTFTLGHPALMQLILLPLNALAAWLLLRRRAGYNYAEVLLANAFISGTLTVINLALMLPVMLLGNPNYLRVTSQLVFIPTVVYSLWVNAQLLVAAPLTKARRYGRALGIAVLQIVMLFMAIMVFIVVLTVQVLRERPDLRKDVLPKKPAKAATH